MSESENSVPESRIHSFPWGWILSSGTHPFKAGDRELLMPSEKQFQGHQGRVRPVSSESWPGELLCCVFVLLWGILLCSGFLIPLSWLKKIRWEESGTQRHRCIFDSFLASVSVLWFIMDFPMQPYMGVPPNIPALHDPCSHFQSTQKQDPLRSTMSPCTCIL